MNQRTVKVVATGTAVLLIGGLIAGLFWLTNQVIGAGSKSAPAASVSAAATAAAEQSANPLAATQTSDFINRVLKFEDAYQNRFQPGGLDRLAEYATPKYVKAHTPPPGSTESMPAQDVVIKVSQDVKKTIVVPTESKADPNERYVTVTPTISTSQKQADGKLTPLEPDHPTGQTDATTWRNVNGLWLADEDR